MSRILLVAADSDLRDSIEFALLAEGHDVTSRNGIAAAEPALAFDCTILDHHAAADDMPANQIFCRNYEPVILLANSPGHPLSAMTYTTVLKPLLGPALIHAVRGALAARELTK
jgi:CheY-like chemotaxis protein